MIESGSGKSLSWKEEIKSEAVGSHYKLEGAIEPEVESGKSFSCKDE